MRGFVDQWNRERPPLGGQFVRDDAGPPPILALEWLTEASGVPEATLRRLMARKSQGTELRIADALTAALNATALFYDGDPPTLYTYPNSRAPRELRAECCGGTASLNGSGSTQ